MGLGCNNLGVKLDEAASLAVIYAALDEGINFFDTADIYGEGRSESFLGKAVAGRRGQVILASKFGMVGGASPANVRRSAEQSLRRLQTDYLDLYYVHQFDPRVPLAETVGAMQALVRQGKVREIGCSNFTADQLADTPFACVQNEFSLLHRDPEVDGTLDMGAAFVPFFPLASGLLTGKYRRGQPPPAGSRLARGSFYNEESLNLVEDLIGWCQQHHHSLLELAFAWLLKFPQVASVIAGATGPEQVRANVRAGQWRLTDAEFVEVKQVLTHVAV